MVTNRNVIYPVKRKEKSSSVSLRTLKLRLKYSSLCVLEKLLLWTIFTFLFFTVSLKSPKEASGLAYWTWRRRSNLNIEVNNPVFQFESGKNVSGDYVNKILRK